MKTKIILLSFIGALAFPLGVFALSTPTVDSVPGTMDAAYYTFTIHVATGAKVTVVGGPAFIPPVTDGAGSDALDGTVEVMVGLAQEQKNVFSITSEKDGAFSNSISVTINESSATQGGDLPPGDHTPPDVPQVNIVDNPVVAYEYEIVGSTEASANIYVKNPDGSSAGSTQANANGIFRVTVDLQVGKTNRFNVSAEDAAGNIGSATQVVVQAVQPEGPAPEEVEDEPEADLAEEDEPLITKNNLPFVDTVGHWAEDYIAELYSKGYVSGKSETEFDPNALITRAELAKIVVNVFEYPVFAPVEISPFPDVAINAWYAPYVSAAKTAAITGGFPDGTFKPGEKINRAAALKMLVVASGLDYLSSTADFTDVRQSDWFASYVGFAQEEGIVSGYEDGTFRAANLITRAEVVKIAVILLEKK